jgi:hypothetical protein
LRERGSSEIAARLSQKVGDAGVQIVCLGTPGRPRSRKCKPVEPDGWRSRSVDRRRRPRLQQYSHRHLGQIDILAETVADRPDLAAITTLIGVVMPCRAAASSSFEAGRSDPEISAEDFVLIAVTASGYGGIAEHSEPVFAKLGMIEDTVRLFGGHLIMPTANAATKRCSKAARWWRRCCRRKVELPKMICAALAAQHRKFPCARICHPGKFENPSPAAIIVVSRNAIVMRYGLRGSDLLALLRICTE